jgi:hypothetical protein
MNLMPFGPEPYLWGLGAWLFWAYCYLDVKVHTPDPIPAKRAALALAEREAVLRDYAEGKTDQRRVTQARRSAASRQKAASAAQRQWKNFRADVAAANRRTYWRAGVALVAAFGWAHLYVTISSR